MHSSEVALLEMTVTDSMLRRGKISVHCVGLVSLLRNIKIGFWRSYELVHHYAENYKEFFYFGNYPSKFGNLPKILLSEEGL